MDVPEVLCDPADVDDDPKESRANTDHTPEDVERMVQEEEDLLASIPVPGVPTDEQAR